MNQSEHKPKERFIRIKAVSELVGYGKTKITELVSKGEFPKPIKLTDPQTQRTPKSAERSNNSPNFWLESEVLQWMEDRITASRQDQGGAL